ncbi:MAG: NAD(P)H-hydrate dehydratase, partial [Deltaproteobacteria bacterium]
MQLPTANQMQGLDQTTIIEIGIPGLILMENAGLRTVDFLVEKFGDPSQKVVSIFVGPGNNGGDGLVVARHLMQRGALPRILLLGHPQNIKGDAAINLAIARQLELPIRVLENEKDVHALAEEVKQSWLLVDALFGTGLKREVTGHFATAIELLNQAGPPVVAVDIPSGLDSDTGRVLGTAVHSSLTVTYGLAKAGHFLYPGRELTGELRVADIGIPASVTDRANIRTRALTAEEIKDFLPSRPPAGHKGIFGHLLVLAGSIGKTGAAILTARAAMRTGVGLLTLCVAKNLNPIFETALTEAMTIALPHSKDRLSDADLESIEAALAGKKACAIGPGLGTDPQTESLVLALCRRTKLPMVIDADAINILAGKPSMLDDAPAPRILTPHPGEMSRLAGLPTSSVIEDRLQVARKFAMEHNIYLVLKGADTVIAAPNGEAAINTSGNVGMASGGMGDALTGIIAGLLCQGLSPWLSCCLGVYVHGLAGDLVAKRCGIKGGLLAGELADTIPAAFSRLLSRKSIFPVKPDESPEKNI